MDLFEYVNRRRWDAASMIAEHQLLAENYWGDKRGPGRGARWVIGKPGSSDGLTEIIAGIGGSLVVHGDYDVCRFAYHGDSTAWERLIWMGDSNDLTYYVPQKAAIGMSRVEVEEYDAAVAKTYLRERIGELREEGEPDQKLLSVLTEALDKYCDDGDNALRTFLSENDEGWDLWEWRLGRVPGWRVLICQALMNKCASLLRERYGKLGPPACRPAPPLFAHQEA